MYNIIGADGRTYGPVTVEQIRRWIGEGRVHAQTPAQAPDAAAWKTLDAFPEFAEALAAKIPPPPGAPPAAAAAGPSPLSAAAGAALADAILARGYTLEIGQCFQRAWALYTQDFWTFLAANAVIWILSSLSHGTAVGMVLSGPLLAGLCWYSLKRIRHQPAPFEEIFSGFSLDFLQTMLAGVVTTVLIVLGLVLCVAPGIYLMIAWAFALPLIMDQRLPFWDAMEVSRRVVSRHGWGFLGMLALSILLGLCGILVCIVGLFFTLPLITLAWLYAYEDIFGTPGKTA